MAERAHPDDPGFRSSWSVRWLAGVIPIPRRSRNPYREALFWRYRCVAKCCQGKDVLDIPCGLGWGTSLLRGCRSLCGVDISPEAINEATARYGDRATFSVGDMSKLAFPDASMDLISCLEGIEHVPPSVGATFVLEAARVLRPGGEMIMSSPHCNDGAHSGNPCHVKEYTPEELRALVAPCFEVFREEQRTVDNLTVTMFFLRRRTSA